MLLIGLGIDGVTGTHPDHHAVAGRDQADAVGDVQSLAYRVGVPVGAGARGEADQLTIIRDAPSPRCIGLTYTSPVKLVAGAFAVGLIDRSSMLCPFEWIE